MKAIRVSEFGGPNVMRLEDAPKPSPGPDQVLVRVCAVGVNPVDAYVRTGKYAVTPALPYTPGGDAAGTVEAFGDGVGAFALGDRVYTCGTVSGAYAEHVLCAATQVHLLPDRVTFAQGAAIGVPYATAHRALFKRAGAAAGETVLIHGATGGVGLAAVQLAYEAGLTVFASGGTDRGRNLVRENGAACVFDHTATDYLQRVREASGGAGVDIIIEMLANVNLNNDLTLLAKHGRVVVVGSRGPLEIDPRRTMANEVDIRGMMLFAASADEMRGIHAALIAGLETGALNPVVGKEFPLADAPLAHEAIMQPGAYGKIVLIP